MINNKLLIFFVATVFLCTSACSAKSSTAVKKTAVPLVEVMVNRITDGDTLHVQLNGQDVKVRIIGIDCPEITGTPEAYAIEAKTYVENLLLEKTVWLQNDTSDEDKYGRKLRYVWIEKPHEINDVTIKKSMLSALLLENGLAKVMTIEPNTQYASLFTQLEAEAQRNKKGIWSQ